MAKGAEILINDLIRQGYLKSDIIIKAFSEIDRAEFVPEDSKSEAYANAPLPIGEGQTISQPLTVAFMLELLNPCPGQSILDIGSERNWLIGKIILESISIPRKTIIATMYFVKLDLETCLDQIVLIYLAAKINIHSHILGIVLPQSAVAPISCKCVI